MTSTKPQTVATSPSITSQEDGAPLVPGSNFNILSWNARSVGLWPMLTNVTPASRSAA